MSWNARHEMKSSPWAEKLAMRWKARHELKCSPWAKTSEIELWISSQKKKKSPPIAITSLHRYLICFYNINATPVEPNSMMCILCTSYICKSEIMLEEGMANWVTMACFHFAICYECVDWMSWKLQLPPPASCIGCTMYYECICTSQFEIPPSWVRRDHSSRKSS